MKLGLTEAQCNIIKKILAPYPHAFFLFGSRVKGTQKKFSDLDICYKADIADAEISHVLAAFDQSDLPFKVDIVAWSRCAPEFQKHIEKDLISVDAI